MADSSFLRPRSESIDSEQQAAVLENAKDKLRMATIERKRYTSINATGGGIAGKTIDDRFKEKLELEKFI